MVAVLSLALGIGANVATFTLISALLLRDLPVPHPERLVELSVVRHGETPGLRAQTFLSMGLDASRFERALPGSCMRNARHARRGAGGRVCPR